MRVEESHRSRRSGWTKRAAWRWARVGAFVLLVWSLVAWVAAEALIVKSELAQADALVVLAGSSTYVERTRRAAQLCQEGRAP